MCGKTRQETGFRHRRRLCISCEDAPTRRCSGCGEKKPRASFHKSKGRTGLRTLCTKCRYSKERDTNIRNARQRHLRLQGMVFEAYGRVCACCGEHRRSMLTIDHIDNDGAAHRKALTAGYKAHKWRGANLGGTAVYADLVKRGFPPGFQVLCANCNASKARNGGVCEHQTEGATTIRNGVGRKRLAVEAPDTLRGDDIVCSA